MKPTPIINIDGKRNVTFQEVFDVLSRNKALKRTLCSIPHFYGLGIGGGLSYRGSTTNDIDLIPFLKKSFKDISQYKQWQIINRIASALPNSMFGLPVDKGFFQVVDRYGFLDKFGQVDTSSKSVILTDYASEFDDDLLMREGQESIESIEVFRC